MGNFIKELKERISIIDKVLDEVVEKLNKDFEGTCINVVKSLSFQDHAGRGEYGLC